jgi:hypothetical protein
MKKNEIKLREEIFNENEKYNNILMELEGNKLKLIEIENGRKRLQQSEDMLKKKIEQVNVKVGEYEVQIEDKNNVIK